MSESVFVMIRMQLYLRTSGATVIYPLQSRRASCSSCIQATMRHQQGNQRDHFCHPALDGFFCSDSSRAPGFFLFSPSWAAWLPGLNWKSSGEAIYIVLSGIPVFFSADTELTTLRVKDQLQKSVNLNIPEKRRGFCCWLCLGNKP